MVTGLAGGDGTVDYRVALSTADGNRVTAVLRDADGVQVATGTGAEGTLTVDRAQVGAGDGYLYDLESIDRSVG